MNDTIPGQPTSVPPVPHKIPQHIALSIAKEVLIFVAIAVGIVLPFRLYIAEPYIVSGDSMDPTFTSGDYLIVDKLSYHTHEPLRGSVVIFKFPTQTSRDLIKRIIGLPGETVTMTGTTITIRNAEHPEGFTLDQSYITYPVSAAFSITLKQDEYFVLGDNRPVSYDSRAWGVLPKSDILGRPIFRLLPLSGISIWPGDHSVK